MTRQYSQSLSVGRRPRARFESKSHGGRRKERRRKHCCYCAECANVVRLLVSGGKRGREEEKD